MRLSGQAGAAVLALGAATLCVVLLSAPALWNGFPLIFYDTGGYLARWYEGTLGDNRAVPYGLLLSGTAFAGFWPVVLLQSALCTWLVALVLRAHGLGGRPLLMLAVIGVLSALSTLSWLTSLLLTDIFCGFGVLAFYLLLRHRAALSRIESGALIALAGFSAATHSATLVLMLGLLMAAGLLAIVQKQRAMLVPLGQGLSALVLSIGLVFAANALVAKEFAWTPGGLSFPFGRMLQDGIVNRYLDDHCPDKTLKLCAYKDELPDDGDEWFWSNDIFNKLGRFQGLGREMEHIALDSTLAYPAMQARTAAIATAKQLVRVRTGEGMGTDLMHSYGIIERYVPQLVPAMRAARQQLGTIDYRTINQAHVPIALLAMILLPAIMLLAWRGVLPASLGEFAVFGGLTLMGNAVICGVLSNPHDRYGARVVWLAVLIAAVAASWTAVQLLARTGLPVPAYARRSNRAR